MLIFCHTNSVTATEMLVCCVCSKWKICTIEWTIIKFGAFVYEDESCWLWWPPCFLFSATKKVNFTFNHWNISTSTRQFWYLHSYSHTWEGKIKTDNRKDIFVFKTSKPVYQLAAVISLLLTLTTQPFIHQHIIILKLRMQLIDSNGAVTVDIRTGYYCKIGNLCVTALHQQAVVAVRDFLIWMGQFITKMEDNLRLAIMQALKLKQSV